MQLETQTTSFFFRTNEKKKFTIIQIIKIKIHDSCKTSKKMKVMSITLFISILYKYTGKGNKYQFLLISFFLTIKLNATT